jgi:ABC-type multidrug transport system ATPase subunit
LEEADELADRVCIMTKGKLLALDKPENIKKQFGVGYKLLIEPKSDQINHASFLSLKKLSIDPFILSQENREKGFKESSDSTSKMLVYQIPLK